MDMNNTRFSRVGRNTLGFLGAALLGGLLVMTAETAFSKTPPPVGKITPWAAMKIAAGKVPGNAISATYEYDEGHWVYGVMVVSGSANKQLQEVEIDPTTGKVGDVEKIEPEAEGKEMTAELNKALGRAAASGKEADEKDEKDEKPKKK